jgi:hypothetical protein
VTFRTRIEPAGKWELTETTLLRATEESTGSYSHQRRLYREQVVGYREQVTLPASDSGAFDTDLC